MINNLDSNTTRKVVRVFLDAFESSRVVTKTVNTQLLQGQFNPASGANVDFKRPHQYNVRRTATGDISSGTNNDIVAGKATGTVQDYFTAKIPWTNFEEALQLDQLEDIIAPAARQIVTDLEVDFGKFMLENAGQLYGTFGTGASAWPDISGANALMHSVGIPQDSPWYYVTSPFSQVALASAQATTIAPGGGDLVINAWENARIGRPFAGMQALMSNALGVFTTGTSTDLTGTLAATPDGTYVTAKDTMTQSLSLAGLTASATLVPGQVLVFTGTGADARTRLNISTRQPILDAAGNPEQWSCVITEGVTLDGTGAGVVTVASAAINETDGQYNNISTALASGDVFTIQGAASTAVQPSLFYHEQAFGIGTVSLPKLHTWDTRFTTEDGFSIRMTMYSDGDANTQSVRFDLLPAYAVFNPNFAGQGWGS